MGVYSTVTPSLLGTKVPFVETETKKFRLIQSPWTVSYGRKITASWQHMFPFSWCHSKLSFSLPWSFLKMRPNPMLQTYQCFFPKSGADLPSFFSPPQGMCIQCQVWFLQSNTWLRCTRVSLKPLDKGDSRAPAQLRTFFLPMGKHHFLGLWPENLFTVKGMS